MSSKPKSKPRKRPYFVYLLLCSNDSIYTGITDNVAARFKAHKAGKGARYTKAFKPVKILYTEKFSNRSKALKREYAIKLLPRKKKLLLV